MLCWTVSSGRLKLTPNSNCNPRAKVDSVSEKRYQWAAPGDVNAFFGLMLDNIADLLLTVGLLSAVFGFPTSFALQYMVPGTAIGVFVGDVIFTWMAFRLAKRTGRGDVTAMPLGLDTPSTFGMVFFVLGPAFLFAGKSAEEGGLGLGEIEAATYAWQIGICAIFISGLFKIACAFGSKWIQNAVPRAGLLGSLAAIALVLISFMPLLEVLHYPVVGMVSLAIILTALVARVKLPFHMPGALGALLVASAVYYIMLGSGLLHAEKPPFQPEDALLPTGWFSVFTFSWFSVLGDSLRYLPIVIPFALGTVVGGIDCTESAKAAGDDYHAGKIIGVEGLATVVAALCGGVIQSTPYIGHPAYKAMGGRAAYTLATALFVGSAGVLGYFGYLYFFIPKAAIFTILIFIGLEITAQSYHATPRRHYAALALACVPAMAKLVVIYAGQIIGVSGSSLEVIFQRDATLGHALQTMQMLSGGFIVTSLLWASLLAAIIDRRLYLSGLVLVICGAFTLFGVMHSPFPDEQLFWPWAIPELPEAAAEQTPIHMAAAYFVAAALMFAWGWWMEFSGQKLEPLAQPKHVAE